MMDTHPWSWSHQRTRLVLLQEMLMLKRLLESKLKLMFNRSQLLRLPELPQRPKQRLMRLKLPDLLRRTRD